LTPIKLRYTGKVIDLVHAFDSQNVLHTEPIDSASSTWKPPVGRVIFNDHLPEEMPVHQRSSQEEGSRAARCSTATSSWAGDYVQMLDEVKNLGFLYATRAGISIGIDDMVVPGEKAALVKAAEKKSCAVESQYQDGADHARRALQQDHRNLVESYRTGFR
jgi:DNA-directed RNA polymerase subunit beta'